MYCIVCFIPYVYCYYDLISTAVLRYQFCFILF